MFLSRPKLEFTGSAAEMLYANTNTNMNTNKNTNKNTNTNTNKIQI